MNIFLTGGSGLLAGGLASVVTSQFNHTNTKLFLGFRSSEPCSVNGSLIAIRFVPDSVNLVIQVLRKYDIDIIVHSAALADVEGCEADVAAAYRSNCELTHIYSEAAAILKIKMIYVSTDQVYSGDGPHKESDICRPANIYGKTKLLGERIALGYSKKNMVLRTNFFGRSLWGKKSFSQKIIESIERRKKFGAFDDVFFNPVSFPILYRVIIEASWKKIPENIVNIGSREKISKYQFGEIISDIKNDNSMSIYKSYLTHRNDLVPRPLDMTTDINLMERIFFTPPSIVNQIKEAHF